VSHGRLIPYDFRKSGSYIESLKLHVLQTNLKDLPKVPLEDVKKALPPPISIPELVVDTYRWKEYLSIGIIVFVGILLLSLMKRRPKLSE